MTELDYAYFNYLLQQEKESLLEFIDPEGMGKQVSLKDSIGELSLIDNHPADTGTELFERSKDLALHEKRLKTLAEIDSALERMAQGDYGRCLICGQKIAGERLEALPYTPHCLNCQESQEEQSKEEEDRPVEEYALEPPFKRTFKDGHDYTGFDGEDAWQKVARYGTSSTPQDVPGNVDNPAFVESEENIGIVEQMDELPSTRGYRRKKDQGEEEDTGERKS
ncbi:MAG: TraR/DksA C4-type zinc finger protein [Dethiobacteria bacterium]|jgi:YteA family regulatory protein